MQLDRVRRHAGLSVLEIEEGDTDDARVRAKPQLRPRRAHLPAAIRRRSTRTRRRRRLSDHLVGTRVEKEVEILVLVPDEYHRRVDAGVRSNGSLVAGTGVGRSWLTNCAIEIDREGRAAATPGRPVLVQTRRSRLDKSRSKYVASHEQPLLARVVSRASAPRFGHARTRRRRSRDCVGAVGHAWRSGPSRMISLLRKMEARHLTDASIKFRA
jgi:hypothetical protein